MEQRSERKEAAMRKGGGAFQAGQWQCKGPGVRHTRAALLRWGPCPANHCRLPASHRILLRHCLKPSTWLLGTHRAMQSEKHLSNKILLRSEGLPLPALFQWDGRGARRRPIVTTERNPSLHAEVTVHRMSEGNCLPRGLQITRGTFKIQILMQ